MEPGIVGNRTKHLQTIITLGLALVLVAIVAGYVYVGMKRAAPAPAPVVENTPTSTTESSDTSLTAEEKAEILRKLSVESTVTIPEAEKQVILENLQQAPAPAADVEPIDMTNN